MIVLIAGTRPELLKLAPVLTALGNHPYRLLFTGQHDVLADSTGVLQRFGTRMIPIEGPSERADPFAYAQRLSQRLEWALEFEAPRWVVVQGDTASALAGALAAHAAGRPLAHVEAGLRTGDVDDPWPEERIRIQIGQMAQAHFCPTERAWRNLVLEDCPGKKWVTGNTVVDALQAEGFYHRIEPEPGVPPRVMVTLHRRESFGEPLRAILRGLYDACLGHPEVLFMWPMHPNPNVEAAFTFSEKPTNLHVSGPLQRREFLYWLAERCQAVLTDSGGVIEEACTLGIPCVIARDHTERPEAVEIGSARLVGREAPKVAEALNWALSASVSPSQVFGNGTAAPKIAHILTTL